MTITPTNDSNNYLRPESTKSPESSVTDLITDAELDKFIRQIEHKFAAKKLKTGEDVADACLVFFHREKTRFNRDLASKLLAVIVEVAKKSGVTIENWMLQNDRDYQDLVELSGTAE